MPDDFATLTVKYDNKSPVELLALAGALDALGKQYIGYVQSQGFAEDPDNVRLYVDELRTGSIIAVLKDIADQVSFVYHHREMLGGFVTQFNDLIQFFVGVTPSREIQPTRQEAERVAQIMEPVAKEGGSQLFIQVTGNNNTIIMGHSYTSERARATQEGVRRYLGPSLPTQGYFDRELLFLHQVRGEVRARAGDFGVIEKFSPKPVKLLFTTEDAKRIVLDCAHPFGMAFVVSGQISTIRGEPSMYKIFTVHDFFEK
jgi:hypothetical protein